MMRSNNQVLTHRQPARALAVHWSRLLLGLSLLLVAAACSTTPSNIGVGLPSVDPTTGAYLVDTLTLRSSTVLRDSVVTSTSNYLLVGRYVDPQLGTITARSYSTLSLGGAFTPDRSYVMDSVVLVLKPDTYRYGDTTKTQTLVEVHELNSFLPLYTYGFASPRLTSMTGRVNQTTVLNETQPIPQRRAQPKLNNLRLRLDKTIFGKKFMDAGQAGQLTTQDQLDALCAGLALYPGANDAAALLRMDASTGDQALTLYYHDPADVTTSLSHAFALTNRHFYQAEAARPSQLNFKPSIALYSSSTAEQTYIEGLLGLQTKIEIPYLYDLRTYGQHFTITSAVMTAQVPSYTLGFNLAPPATISIATTDVNNRVGTTFVSSTYSPSIASIDGVDHAGYSWSVQAYVQNVLSNNIPNNGMLLNTSAPTLPERVVLGSARNNGNKLQLRLYLIRND